MTQLEHRLIYSGDCEDAIDLYVSAFDADITSLIRFSEIGVGYPAWIADKVAHAELSMFGGVLRVADAIGDQSPRVPMTSGIVILAPEMAVRQAIAVLTGSTAQPWTPEWSLPRASAEVVDPFGVLWCFTRHPGGLDVPALHT